MKIRKEIFATIFLFLIIQSAVGYSPQVIMFVAELAIWAMTIWQHFNTDAVGFEVKDFAHDVMMKFATNRFFKEVSQSIPELSLQLEAIRQDSDKQMRELAQLITMTGIETRMSIKLTELENQMGIIDRLFREFKSIIPSGNESVNLEKLCDFAKKQLYEFPISEKVASTLNVVFPTVQLQKSLLDLTISDFELQGENICGLGYSPHQYLHAVYLGLLTIEIKAYIIEAFSHSLLSTHNGTHEKCVYKNENADTSVMEARRILVRDLRILNSNFIERMRKLPRNFRACDQENDFERDVTFFELEGAIQGILTIRKAPLIWETEDCRVMDTLYNRDRFDMPELKFRVTHPVRSCSGRTFNCEFAGPILDSCLETNGSRRYKWIDQGNHIKSGDRSTGCEEKNHMWYNDHQFIFCLCDCNDNDAESPATHIFNLQTVESDVADNMVITGIRFIVQYRILYIQIQQGKLGVNWRVTEVDWKPLNDISDEVRRARLGRPAPRGSRVVEEDKDFLILKKGENNAINFDTLEVPHQYVLTGVKFSMSKKDSPHKRIAISLIATRFDHITGKLCTHCQRKVIESEQKHDHELKYNNINAYKPTFPTLPKSESGQFVTFDSSDRQTDAGQATLPYFDAIPVESNPPSPLGGVGILYKTKDDFAGFLSLQLISIDYTKYMEDSERDLAKKVTVTKHNNEE